MSDLEGLTYWQLDRRWYELRRARERATGTSEYGAYQAEMDKVWAAMMAREEQDRAASRTRPVQVIGAAAGGGGRR